MATKLKKGDKVEWGTSQGKTQGVVKKKLTSPMKIKGHKVAASKSNPEYLVESSKSGEQAAHKPEALKKTTTKGSDSKKKSTGTGEKKAGKTGVKSAKASSAKKKTASASKKVTRAKKKSSSKKSSNKEDDETIVKKFTKLVNLKPKRLGKWLESKESKKVGFKNEGNGESVGHKSGKKIVKLLAKRRDKYTDGDLKHMHKVVSYIKRHLAQRPNGDVTASNWRYSLMNWGHDPAK